MREADGRKIFHTETREREAEKRRVFADLH